MHSWLKLCQQVICTRIYCSFAKVKQFYHSVRKTNKIKLDIFIWVQSLVSSKAGYIFLLLYGRKLMNFISILIVRIPKVVVWCLVLIGVVCILRGRKFLHPSYWELIFSLHYKSQIFHNQKNHDTGPAVSSANF